MIYKFLLLSDESENFSLEVKIDPESTFLQLNDTIIDALKYSKDQLTSFFICEDNWEKKTEITLIEMDSSSDEDVWTMENTKINEFVEDEHQRLLFVYDMMGDRSFFMELREIIPNKDLEEAVCTKSRGDAPVQIMPLDEFDNKLNASSSDLDADFYGDSEYNLDELDQEGFEGLSDGIMDNPYDDDRY